MQTNVEISRQAAELARLPIGTAVLVRDAKGMGLGTIRSHITDNGGIPLIGWAKCRVVFWDDFGEQASDFKTSELYRASLHEAIRGTVQNIRHVRNAAQQSKRSDIVSLCDEALRFGAGSRAYTRLCDHLTTGAAL